MDPNAALFSPSRATANVNLAVVPFQGSNGVNGCSTKASSSIANTSQSSKVTDRVQGQSETPHDLIVHETLKQVLREVQELRARCGSLEAANVELKSNMQLLIHSFSANVPGTPEVNGNLTGYASSDASSSGKFGTPAMVFVVRKFNAFNAEPQMSSQKDFESLNRHVDQHVTTVKEILERFRDYLTTEMDARKTLERQVDEIRRNLTGVKGRTGTLEAKCKAISADIDELELAQNDKVQDSHFIESNKWGDAGSVVYFQDKVEKLEGQFNMTLMDVNELHNDVKAQGVVVNELQAVIIARDKDTTDGWTARTIDNTSLNADASYQIPFMQANMVSSISSEVAPRRHGQRLVIFAFVTMSLS